MYFFLVLKRRYFPGRFRYGPALDHVLTEVKGGEILGLTRNDSRNKRRQAKLVRYALIDLLERYDCRVVGRVWVKEKRKSRSRTRSSRRCRPGWLLFGPSGEPGLVSEQAGALDADLTVG